MYKIRLTWSGRGRETNDGTHLAHFTPMKSILAASSHISCSGMDPLTGSRGAWLAGVASWCAGGVACVDHGPATAADECRATKEEGEFPERLVTPATLTPVTPATATPATLDEDDVEEVGVT